MDEPAVTSDSDLGRKIARLVQERGWNQEDFARRTGLHRQTVRHLLHADRCRLHNATVRVCSRALGLTVHELRGESLDQLLARMVEPRTAAAAPETREYEETFQPELPAWVARNPDRAAQLTPEEMDELRSLQGTGGPLTASGVESFVTRLERRRRLVEQVLVVAGTEYLDLMEQFVEVLFEKVQPYRERR